MHKFNMHPRVAVPPTSGQAGEGKPHGEAGGGCRCGGEREGEGGGGEADFRSLMPWNATTTPPMTHVVEFTSQKISHIKLIGV